MKKFTFLILSLFLYETAYCQKIAGIISDNNNQPLPHAIITLFNTADSAIVKIEATTNGGRFSFNNVTPGNYFINITCAGYTETNTNDFDLFKKDTLLPAIALDKKVQQLQEVVIDGKRPLLEIKADKIIFNVDNSINATGSDAMELLRKAPGVVIDREDNIVMNGRNGVNVYIDGRMTPLTGQALTAYLRSLPSNGIDAVEIIQQPSAKYDAAGNAGIINIKLKKNTATGTNGSVQAGWAYGERPKYNTGFTLNSRSSNLNFFANYNYTNATNISYLRMIRSLADSGFDQNSITSSHLRTHNYKAGMDYFINKNNTAGIIITGNNDRNNIGLYSTTPIIYTPTNTIKRWLVADNNNQITNNNLNVNFNYRHTGARENELNIDADHGRYKINTHQMQPNFYYDSSFTELIAQNIYEMVAPSEIVINTIKADYEHHFKKGKLLTGGKFSYVTSDNNFEQYFINSPIMPVSNLLDSAKSNNFKYTENINAAYASYHHDFKTFSLQAGLRVENSQVSGYSNGFKKEINGWVLYDSAFKRNYTNLFPSISLHYNINSIHQLGLGYNRRIDRPAYQDLNPFEIKIDEYAYYKGNTALRPQYTQSVSLQYSFASKLNARLTYSSVKDVFTRLMDTAELVKSYLTRKNLATQKILSLSVSFSHQYKWYSLFVNTNSFASKYHADFGNGRKIDLDVISFTTNLQQTANLGSGWLAEMSSYYNAPAIWSGTFRSKHMFGVEAGLQKKLFKEKAVLRLLVTDVLGTVRWKGNSNFAGQDLEARFWWESRQAKVNFTYRFGNAQLKAARQRKTAADEEGKRVSNGGGGLQNKPKP
jgi:iron complex outermembrane recepter protein